MTQPPHQNQSDSPSTEKDQSTVSRHDATHGANGRDTSRTDANHDANLTRTDSNVRELYANQTPDSEYSLTVSQAVEILHKAGLPASPRTVQKWCKRHKLQSKTDSHHHNKLYIARDSLEALVATYQERTRLHHTPKSHPGTRTDANHDANGRDTSRTDANHDAKRRDSQPTSDTPDQTNMPAENDSKQIAELQDQLRDKEIANRFKDQWIKRLEKDREGWAEERQTYIHQLNETSHKLGIAEGRLRQLTSGSATKSHDTVRETEPVEIVQ